MVADLLENSRKNIEAMNIGSADDARAASKAVIDFSPEVTGEYKELKAFLMKNMYRHYKVNRMTHKSRMVVRELFEFYLSNPDCLPKSWGEAARGLDKPALAVIVCDFIAGMTDRYALQDYFDIFGKKLF